MNYSIKVNEVKNKDGNLRGFATVVFGDSFKITNIAILENREKGELFVSMPRYKSNEKDGSVMYKDICNPITSKFRSRLYGDILQAFEAREAVDMQQNKGVNKTVEIPKFSVTVTPYEREGSNIRGLVRVYLEDSFIINNISILQGKDKLFVAMPSYKTGQVDEKGKAIYQDVCYPVTKEFRDRLFEGILKQYEKGKRQFVKGGGLESQINNKSISI